MFENSTLFGVSEDGTIKKFLMEASIQKLRRHFSALYERYYGYESSAYVFNYSNTQEEMSFVDYAMNDGIINAIADASPLKALTVGDDEWLNIKYIFMGEIIKTNDQDITRIVFQRITKSQVIGKRSGLHLFASKDTLTIFENSMLSIPFRLECYYLDGKLFFNSMWYVRQIFDMEQYIKEATNEDITKFAENQLFTSISGDDFLALVDQQIRSKITSIMSSGVLDKYGARKIQNVAKKIGVELKTKQVDGKGKIIMPDNKKEIKTFLKILDETIYQGMLSGELKESNSSRPYKH